eukprot:scpid59140/ scgid1001/ Synaptonemal complex protein 2; Synaptonemal complex lateral element protein
MPAIATIAQIAEGKSSDEFFRRLRTYIEEKPGSNPNTKCVRKILVRIATILEEERVSDDEVRICLQFIQYLDQTDSEIMKWLNLGLTELLEKVLATLTKPDDQFVAKARKDLLYGYYDRVMMLTNSADAKGKELLRNSVVPKLLTMSCQECHCVPSLVEGMKVVNSLLQCCPLPSLHSLSANQGVKSSLLSMGQKLSLLGDMELQMGFVEGIFRLTTREERERLGSHCFHYERITGHFLSIKDTEFEPDCRRFLNALNGSMANSSKRVITLPCCSAYVGDVQLQRPKDKGLSDFWVDFNPRSLSMTLFIQDTAVESDVWDTVAVCKENVKSFHLTEGINEGHQLTIQLSEALTHISNSHQVKIFLKKEYDPRAALYQVFGKELEKSGLAKKRVNRMSVAIASLLISGGKTTISESPVNSAPNSQASPPAQQSPIIPRQALCATPNIKPTLKTPKTSTPISPCSQQAPHSNLPVITQVTTHLPLQPIPDGHEEDESPIMSSAPAPLSMNATSLPDIDRTISKKLDEQSNCSRHEEQPDSESFQFESTLQHTMKSSQCTASKKRASRTKKGTSKKPSTTTRETKVPLEKERAVVTAARRPSTTKRKSVDDNKKSLSPFSFPGDDQCELPQPKKGGKVARLQSSRSKKKPNVAHSTKRTTKTKKDSTKDLEEFPEPIQNMTS